MIFVTTLDLIPGKNDDFRKIVKGLKIPEDIRIKEFLSLFGKPDFLIVFEAPNEERAMSFVLKFATVTVPKTSLSYPVDKV
jgi:uncharacterized protein with GYD domain